MKNVVTVFNLLLICTMSFAQPCDGPGQVPSRAFPVCGSTTFKQTVVPTCGSVSLNVPGCNDGALYQDKNPYWYRFTCYKSGTLGFLIKPIDQGDDYDWQLFDITGRDPNDVYTDQSLIVTGNWAGTYGNTGASANGVNFIQCASDPAENENSYAKMPEIIEGHTYLLMVSHFTDSQIGYDLSFGGGTGVITDPTIPALKTAEVACSGDLVRIKLTKKIKCSSIAADGSDFYVTPAGTSSSAVGADCSFAFDTDSILLKLSSALAPGNYQLHIKKGTDGNTLLDACDNSALESDVIPFIILPIAPTPMDSLAPVKCAPKELRLIFKKPIACNSIAANGSDFTINGSYTLPITKAEGICNANGTTKEIVITLAQPLTVKGNFQIVLRSGSDGNTLLDECTQETPLGSFLAFSVKDTVNADFTYSINYSCTEDVVNFVHNGLNEVKSWQWSMDDGKKSTVQSPQARYTLFTQKNIELIVSNGFCSDTSKQVVALENYLKADFTVLPDHCPNEPVEFKSTAVGKIIGHNWSFGDGGGSSAVSPSYTYGLPSRETNYNVRYTVTDSYGCQQTATKPVKIYSSCTIFVPNAFTPGNDGLNDWFRVLNAVKADKFQLNIYNRWGQLIFQTKDWKQGWDGRLKGQLQAAGTYVWFLHYVDTRTGKTEERKGTFVLIR